MKRTINQGIRLNIIYFGKRGGGVAFTRKVITQLEENKTISIQNVFLRRNIEEFFVSDADKISGSKNYAISGIKGLALLKQFFSVLLFPGKNGFDRSITNLITMTSPYSILLEIALRIRRQRIIRVIHDANRHPGDLWPPTFMINWMLKNTDAVIALSGNVARRISLRYPSLPIVVVPHPSLDLETSSQVNLPTSLSNYILFLGRLRKYKGIDVLIRAHKESPGTRGTLLVIAGAGKLKFQREENVIFINRWLTETEIFFLLMNANVVVFPYIEASQSGLLGTCMSLNKKILITTVGALREQTEGYPNRWIVNEGDSQDLGEKLEVALQAEVQATSFEEDKSTLPNAISELTSNFQ